jgi:hypothetical protein
MSYFDSLCQVEPPLLALLPSVLPLDRVLSEPLLALLLSVLPLELVLSEPMSALLSSVLPLELVLSEPCKSVHHWDVQIRLTDSN